MSTPQVIRHCALCGGSPRCYTVIVDEDECFGPELGDIIPSLVCQSCYHIVWMGNPPLH